MDDSRRRTVEYSAAPVAIKYLWLFAVIGLLASACGGNRAPDEVNQSAAPSPGTSTATTSAVARVNACSLHTRADIQAFLGRSVMDGQPDEAAQLSTCSYGNPDTPVLNGKATDVLVQVGIVSGDLPNQARGIYDIAKSNAGESQVVDGLGDVAFWSVDSRTLHVVKGNYLVDVMLGPDLGGLKTAQTIAEKTLTRLP